MRILLPIDPADEGFPLSLRALERIAQAKDEIHVLHVAQPPIEWVSDPTGPAPFDDGPFRRSLEKAMRDHGHGGAQVHVAKQTRRHVGDTIIELAQNIDADLILMPTHGRSGFSRLVLGSVTERVVRGAPCDVYVVRVPHDD